MVVSGAGFEFGTLCRDMLMKFAESTENDWRRFGAGVG